MSDSNLNRRQVLSATGAAIVGGLVMTVSAAAQDGTYSAELTGEPLGVETNASGTATVSVSGGEASYELWVSCLRDGTHVSLSADGETLAEYDLDVDGVVRDTVVLEGSTDDEGLLDALEGEVRITAHTEANPDGEIEGTLSADEAEPAPEEPTEDEEPEEDEDEEEEPEEEEEEPEEDEEDDDEPPAEASFSLGDINVGEGVEPEDEYITIVNEGGEVDLGGFVLRDGPGGVVDAGTVSAFTFPSYTFSEGESVTVYTDDNPAADFSWGIGRQIWNQEGDTVIVDDPDGNTVMEESYDSQVSSIQFVFNQVRSLFA